MADCDQHMKRVEKRSVYRRRKLGCKECKLAAPDLRRQSYRRLGIAARPLSPVGSFYKCLPCHPVFLLDDECISLNATCPNRLQKPTISVCWCTGTCSLVARMTSKRSQTNTFGQALGQTISPGLCGLCTKRPTRR